MSYVWFKSVLEALGKKVNFDSISNLYGNSFAKDSAETIAEANPLVKHEKKHALAGILGAMPIPNTPKIKTNEEAHAVLGALPWETGEKAANEK